MKEIYMILHSRDPDLRPPTADEPLLEHYIYGLKDKTDGKYALMLNTQTQVVFITHNPKKPFT